MLRSFFLIVAALGVLPPSAFAELSISEFMASNGGSLLDEDGASSDWVEIHNSGPGAVDLTGYYLSDDASDLTGWKFPAVIMQPGDYLIVFASGKDRDDPAGELHADFELNAAGEYLALVEPDGVTVVTEFAPRFPPQFEDESYAFGLDGEVISVDLAPDWQFTGGAANFSNVSLTAAGAGTHGENVNSLDAAIANQQRYMWLNFASKLSALPANSTVLSATLRWGGTLQETVGQAGPSVETKIGVFPAPDANRGITSLATAPFGAHKLTSYYAAHTPEAEASFISPGDWAAAWNLKDLVQSWANNPTAPQRGEIILLNDANPTWIIWEKKAGTLQPQLTFQVAATTADSLDPVVGYSPTPTPEAPNSGVEPIGPLISDVPQNPAQPVSGALPITARITPLARPVTSVSLHYRHMFNSEVTVAMNDSGTGADAAPGDGIYTGVIPAAAVRPAEMVRWRVSAVDADGRVTRDPPFRNPTDSHQYYGTVGHDPSIESLLPVVHWFIQNPGGAESLSGARGALYYLGEFYDNVYFNRHGQSTGGFPKKSFNVDFNKTQRFQWSADAPRVRDVDLLTNWADKSKVRHVLAYEVMRSAGVAAHFAFTVRMQQNGQFYSTADMVEDADDIYLERAGLNPEGALYKVYDNTLSSGDTGSAGVEKKTRKDEGNADLQGLINGLQLSGQPLINFIFDNVDVPKVVNMMAANSVIRNMDMHRKNWYAYRDTGRTNEWSLLPWDLDLSHGRRWVREFTYFDNALYVDGFIETGTSVRLVSHLFSIPQTRAMLMRRIRTLHDEFLNPPGTPYADRFYEQRLDEQLALLDPPSITPSDADRDFMKWGSWTQGSGSQVPYTSAHPDVESMDEAILRWKNEYLPGRRSYIYSHPSIPSAQAGSPNIKFGTVEFSPASGNQDEEYIELRNPNGAAVDISGWSLTEAVEFTFEGGTVVPAGGSLFVSPDATAFRARATTPRGGQGHFVEGPYRGHLSSFGETIRLIDASGAEVSSTTFVGNPSDAQLYLRVTEIMYHPADNAAAEFIELTNTSDSATLDLAGVKFVGGVSFDFTGAAVTSLAPGESVLIVRSIAAFEAVYGAGLSDRIAGEFANDSRLDNGGEDLDLEDATGSTIAKFNYGDGADWPAGADGQGYSLVLIDPANADPDMPASWRASRTRGGNPGGADSVAFTGSLTADSDLDGLPDFLEWSLSGTTTSAGSVTVDLRPPSDGSSADIFPAITVPVFAAAEGVVIDAEVSRDGVTWQSGDQHVVLDSDTLVSGGVVGSLTFRTTAPADELGQVLFRIKVTAAQVN